MLRQAFIRALLAVIALLSLLCAGDGWAGNAKEKPLIFGVHPYLSPSELIERFTPLATYLGESIGVPVVVSISRDYEEHISRIDEGKVDLAYIGPSSYVTLASEYGQFPILAVHEVMGKTSFRGVIIMRSGSGITGLSDLKGRKFAFGDPESTMSHLVPRYMMLEAGVDISDLAGFEFLYSHDNVALGVLIGDFDAGAVKEEAFYKYRDRGLEPIEFSPIISEHLFVAKKDMQAGLVSSLRDAMLGLSRAPGGKSILEDLKPGTTGLVRGDNKDYDNLRRIMDTLKKAGVSP